MSGFDHAYSGGIPDAYERSVVPLLFEPYALDLAERVASTSPQSILELAAGTGALTRALHERLPNAEIVATDINTAMLDTATRALKGVSNVRFETQDASALTAPDESFDAVACQFGAMFFPDRPAAYAHVHRVLRAGGTFTFNVWNLVQRNPLSNVIAKAFKAASGGQPSFLEIGPFSYFEPGDIIAHLRSAGFKDVNLDAVGKKTKVHSAAAALDAFISGTPFGTDFEHLGRDKSAQVREAVFEAIVARFGEEEFDNEMSALVIETKK